MIPALSGIRLSDKLLILLQVLISKLRVVIL